MTKTIMLHKECLTPEAEFLDGIGTKILRLFLHVFTVTSTSGFYSPPLVFLDSSLYMNSIVQKAKTEGRNLKSQKSMSRNFNLIVLS
jgi:hypothetical protein